MIALLLQDSFGFKLNQKCIEVLKTETQKKVMTKEMQPALAIKDEWDCKALEAAIIKSQKGGRVVQKNKTSVYNDKIVKEKV